MQVRAYTTLAAPAEAEVEAKRSRFLARLEPVTDEAAARAVIEAARRRHWDARHHCSAFLLGPDAGTARSSDDGEPSGTAGAPILHALTAAGVTDVVAVVTRWFGGTLLGTGGLVRAYGDAVQAALTVAPRRHRRLLVRADVTTDPGDVGRLENELRSRGVLVAGTDYAARATVHLDVAPDGLADLDRLVAQLTSGAARPIPAGEHWADVPDPS